MNLRVYHKLRSKRYKVIAGIIILAVTFAVFVFHENREESDWIATSESEMDTSSDEILEPEENEAKQAVVTPASVIVDMDGEVIHPGVYTLTMGSRVYEAVEMAGGLTEQAETKNINLAGALTDGMKIYIPAAGEAISSSSSSDQTAGRVNINTADSVQLETLPGVGPAMAQKIISYRNEIGNFKEVAELKNVSGIGDKTYEKLKPMVCI